jgi:hypothetical protein
MCRRIRLVVGALSLVGGALVIAGQNEAAAPRDKTRADLSKEVYDSLFSDFLGHDIDPGIGGNVPPQGGLVEIELLNRWSENILAAQGGGRGGRAGEAAIRAHLGRLKSVEEAVREKAQARRVTRAVLAAAAYYRQAAELLLIPPRAL